MRVKLFSVLVALLALLLLGNDPAPAHRAEYARYAVASDHPLASEAGAAVLEQGGTAADAAAATLLALGVVNPQASGLGGGGFALYYDAASGETTFLDFRESAPARATATMFENQTAAGGPASHPSQLGGLASGVPGEMAGIDELLTRFGRLERARVFDPSIRLARDGFPVQAHLAAVSVPFAVHFGRDPVLRAWLGRRSALEEGQTLRQAELGRTLQELARSGSESFYRGRIARAIVAANNRHGGIFTIEDLAAYRAIEREPLEADLVGHHWVTAPPPSAGGYTLLASLTLLDRWIPAARRRDGGPELLHAFAESFKGAFWDRASYFGDPDRNDVPIAELLASERVARRASIFRPGLAMPASAYSFPLAARQGAALEPPRDHGTSHLCVVDAQGNVAAITSTVNLPFGARYTAAGIVMNDEMDDFASSVGRPNAFGLPGGPSNLPAPQSRPVSTMTPTIVFDGSGRPVLCVGGSGGSRIVTATLQVAWHTVVRGYDPLDAIEAPRVHHQGMPDALSTETEYPQLEGVLAQLAARGHNLTTTDSSAVVQMIRIRHDGEPRLVAASDPRKGGEPRGN
jgi:gamma-glutamyltranspeptidase / glutathione hydrolase